LYDFFECNNLLLDNAEIDCSNVNTLLSASHFNLVVGNGGMGKSTLMKHFFLNALENNDFIPIFIELRNYKYTNSLIDYCYNNINTLGFSLEKKYFEYALNSGLFLILFDGYDEITDENKKDFLSTIEDFTDRYSENYFIVSSRPCEEFIGWSRFYKYETMDFSKEKALSLINKLDYDKTIKEKFLSKLDEELYDRHESFASNPLLLNIMLLTFENYAEIPEKLHIFYAQAFETLFAIHDATKPDGFKRNLLSGLPSDVFKKVFSNFCFKSYVKGQIEFTHEEIINDITESGKKVEGFNAENFLEDIKSGVSLIYIDGIKYRFIHRSFQEYFSAVYLKNLGDELQKRACLKIIEKKKISMEYDSVFSMLREMGNTRFEKNVILPYLQQIEDNVSDADRIKSLYCYLVESIVISNYSFLERDKTVSDIKFNWVFSENHVSMYISFNKLLNIHFLLFVTRKYENQRQTPRLNLSKLFSSYLNSVITKETIYKDTALYQKILTETSLGSFVRTLSNLYETIIQRQKEAEDEIEAFFS
jgi:energy-coupling factor transporter ATP-binding protein EcfA2